MVCDIQFHYQLIKLLLRHHIFLIIKHYRNLKPDLGKTYHKMFLQIMNSKNKNKTSQAIVFRQWFSGAKRVLIVLHIKTNYNRQSAHSVDKEFSNTKRVFLVGGLNCLVRLNIIEKIIYNWKTTILGIVFLKYVTKSFSIGWISQF